VLTYIGLLLIFLLAAILYMLFKVDGQAIRNVLRYAKIKECWDGVNRRHYPRFTRSLEVAYSIIKKRAAEIAGGKTVDISEGGVRLLLAEKLPLGACVTLKIALPGSLPEAEMLGNVVWTEDAADAADPTGKRFFYSGIKFSSTKDPASLNFINFIRSCSLDQES